MDGQKDSEQEIGDLHLGTVVVNVQDMARAVDFWNAALGYHPRDAKPDTQFQVLVHSDPARLPISLQLTDHPPAAPAARVHLDLYTAEQAKHVERLVDLGATRVEDWPYPETRTSTCSGTRTATSSVSSTRPSVARAGSRTRPLGRARPVVSLNREMSSG